jgi:hypothetical protein
MMCCHYHKPTHSKDYLNNFPKDAWQALSKEVQDILGEQKKIADKLMKLATQSFLFNMHIYIFSLVTYKGFPFYGKYA